MSGCAGKDFWKNASPRAVGEAESSVSFLPAQWIYEKISICISFQCCVTSCYEFSGLKQHPCICCHVCETEVQAQSDWFLC